MASACALARQRLATFVAQLEPATVADKAGSAIKGGMIGGISAPLKGVVGNLTWGGYKVLAQQPLEAGIDYLQSLGRSIATGGTVKPHEFREVVNALDAGGMRAYGRGFGIGSRTIREGVKAGRDAVRALPPGSGFGKTIAAFMDEVTLRMNTDVTRLGINTPTQVRIQNPTMRAVVEGSFALVEASDRPFFEAAFEMSHYMQAKLAAVRQGLKGAARDAEIDRLIANPTDEMATRALLDAQYATFKDKGALASGIENFRRRLVQLASDPKGTPGTRGGAASLKIAMDLIVPFTGVPTSIVNKGVSMSPLGLLSPRMLDGQAGRSRALANVTLGTSMIAAGYALAKDGLLEGPPPRATNERQDTDATREFNAVRLGDQWLQINELGPLAMPLFVGAALARQQTAEPEASVADRAATAAAAAGRSVAENSFLQGTRRAIEAMGDENKGEAFAAGLAGGLIPAAVGQAARIMDPVDREATTFGERLQNRIPGLRSQLPARGTPFGPQPARTAVERLNNVLPLRLTPDRSTPETEELRRLGVSVGTRPRMVQGAGNERVPLPQDVYDDVLARRAESVLPTIRQVMADPTYQTLSDVEKRQVLQRVVRATKEYSDAPARDAARRLVGAP